MHNNKGWEGILQHLKCTTLSYMH